MFSGNATRPTLDGRQDAAVTGIINRCRIINHIDSNQYTIYLFLEKRRTLKLAIQGTSGTAFGFSSPLPTLQPKK